MPYASKHYPFDYPLLSSPKEEELNSPSLSGEGARGWGFKFPADFIAEGLDQTRGWFYTLLILGTALFDNTPFLNCIVNGIVLAEDGKKMSKRLNNYPEPEIIFNKYGADAMRFYLMNSPVVEAQDLRFSEAWVEEVVKKIILPLWNTYSFFTTYANIDKWTPEKWNIYFVRHAESKTNARSHIASISGASDNPKLTEKWKNQAINEWRKLKLEWVKFDKIYSSPLDRCTETAELIAKEVWYNSSDIILEDALKEQDYSDFEWMLHSEIAETFWIDVNDVKSLRKIYKNSKTENFIQFNERVKKFIDKIEIEEKWKNILIVWHSWSARPFIKEFLDLDLEYAHIEIETPKNSQVIKFINCKLNNILDKWILWELHSLIKEVEQGMDKYMIAEATRPIIKFMDNLTNWYIRRSRKRFWKSENDEDKLQAYETLYEVLITLCRVIAPFMPFISEHIYRNLTNKKSIHLDTFPKSIGVFINEEINSQFEKTARLVNLGLAWRQRNNFRVRQPLLSATIWENLEAYYLDILKEELNVKEIILLESSDKIAKKICKPNARIIGPKFWTDVKFIMNEAKSGNFEELENGKIVIPTKTGIYEKEKSPFNDSETSSEWQKYFILEKDEYEIAFEAWDSSLDIEAWFGMVIALDKNLTPELIDEGIARDIVRQIQETRKEANFEVDDRIQLSLKGESLESILKNFWEYIQNETLSTLAKTIENPDIEKQILIEEKEVTIELKK